MVTFALPQEAYALITGETGRTIHRSYGLTIGADEWRALQRATLEAGKYVVTCEEGAATSLLQWFEGSFDVAIGAGPKCMELKASGLGRLLDVSELICERWKVGVQQRAKCLRLGHQLVQ